MLMISKEQKEILKMKENQGMTAEQFAELMGVTLDYLSKYNARVITRAEKEKGLIIRKEGRGKKARYLLNSTDETTALFDKKDYEFEFDKEFIEYKDLKFKILLALTIKPNRTFFEGELKDLAKEIGEELLEVSDDISKRTNENRIKRIHEAILELQEEEVIIAYYDEKQKKSKTWVLFIRPSAKESLIPINTDGIIYAKDLCDKGAVNMKWENFLKVWLALKVFKKEEKNEFIINDIKNKTGLGRDTIMKVMTYMREQGMLDIRRNTIYLPEINIFQTKGMKMGLHNFDFNLL